MRVFSHPRTRLYSFDPLNPHFCTVNLGCTGVYINFLISAQKHRLWYSLEPPCRGGSNEYPQSMFCAEKEKYQSFLPESFHFFGGKILNIFEKACFSNVFTCTLRLYYRRMGSFVAVFLFE